MTTQSDRDAFAEADAPDFTGRVYYYGCRPGGTGHFPHAQGWQRLSLFDQSPADIPWNMFDAKYPPRGSRGEEFPQGHAAITKKPGWTILAFWDRSEDQRGNSHSTFLIEGDHEITAAIIIARRAFPQVFARFEATGLRVVPA